MLYYILYRLGQFIALHLPLKLAYQLAVIVSDIRLLFAPQDRKETQENLRVIFPEKSKSEIKKICKALFRNFAKYLVDFFCFSKLDKKFIEKKIEIKNIHYFDECLKRGKGVIALTAHIGNWELGGAVAGILGYPLWAVALPHKHKAVDNFFNYQRKLKGINVMPLNKAARQCLVCLEENKLLALVGDRDFKQKGIVIDFFGKKTIFPEGPAIFSLITGAPIICGFMLRKADDSFIFILEEPIRFKPSGNKEKDAKDT
ncbi:MAG: lysophospholipid acyltransferase family protein, partial [Candidatus Omnitrophica bacterium]|nr:lysophospholipid acyltransferase family protein [Candidatus Omnitrophota bacterium]